ncbi:MAG: phage holin family protein [Oscillospiraceae bacterium]|nr:phage holin family protein [Oscillospiraceae bacterium]
MTWDNIIRTISAAVGAAVGFLFGQLNGLFWAVIALMAIDYVTGVIVAVMNKRLSSEVGFRGLVKKLFILVLIAVAHIVDAQIIGQGAAVMTAVMLFFAANEGISILENAANLGLPVPKKLRDILEQLRKDDDNGDNL